MTLMEIILIGTGLAMDAVAVSMTNGMVYRNLRMRAYIAMPLIFGIFQALMPFLGGIAGELFASFISRCAGILIFLILGIIGGRMAAEGIRHMAEKEGQALIKKELTAGILVFQAVATSIDAFAVGIGFSAVQVNILPAICIIAAVTMVLVTIALALGRRFGDVLGSRAEILGGVILIMIGIKAVIA